MCGIAGLIGIRDEGAILGRRLMTALRHRGPDDEGIEQPSSTVTLVHTRLAVIDLSPAGHQPMRDHPPPGLKPNWVVFNGEIYNYRELQHELAASGWPSRTNCDTEVILHAFRIWGDDCVSRFRGMFAFCLVDTARGLAYLYRDRLGIKPLYIHWFPAGGCVFASELRAILRLGMEIAPARVNPRALESFFAQGAVQGYETLVDDVSMLRPASHLTLDLESGREVSRRQYWHLPIDVAPIGDRKAAADELGAIAHDAVRLHLVSDAPLGLFLSSGIDSTALLAIASEEGANHPRTLTVGFDSERADESIAASAIARAFGSDHRTVPLTSPDAKSTLEGSLAAMDQPTVDGFNTYFVSRAAREQGLTAALSGLGGDELFGGYASFVDIPRAMRLRRRSALKWPVTVASRMLRTRFGAKLGEVYGRDPDSLAMYLLRRELFLPDERRGLHPLPAGSDPVTGIERGLLEEARHHERRLDRINAISLFELQFFMRHMLLRDADAFSMAAPIEYRVPFLDHRLVEAVFAMPGEWKRPDPRPKPLLLDIAGPRVPESVWRRPKQGFAFPWGSWFHAEPLRGYAREAIADERGWKDLGIDAAAVGDLHARFDRGDRRVGALQVLALLSLHDFTQRHRLHRV
jgi:asparagine synthase (glutamine-hydrolysing)